MQDDDLIILIPVFEDLEALKTLVRQLYEKVRKRFYLVIIDDGSIRHPPTAAEVFFPGIRGKIIRLHTNLGHQRALAVGICHIAECYEGHPVLIMDSDGEDRPENIERMLDKLASDTCDLVVSRRGKRSESAFFKCLYCLYKILFRLLTGHVINFGNFMVFKPHAIKRLAHMPEIWLHIPASVIFSKLRIEDVISDRGTRYCGKSKMNITSLILHGIRGILVFSETVLVRIFLACTTIAAFSLAFTLIPLFLKTIGMATPGWASSLILLFTLVFLQSTTIALVAIMLTQLSRPLGSNLTYTKYIADE